MHDPSRRELLKGLGVSAFGASLGLAGQHPFFDDRANIKELDGAIIGDDFALAHRWRDGGLSFKPTHPTHFETDVLIIGGGVAGLTSAWRLIRAGIRKFKVLERSPQMGGLSRSGKMGSLVFPWGAHYVDPPAKESKGLLHLYRDLGVVVGAHPVDGRPLCNPDYIVRPPHHNVVARGRWSRGIVPWHLATPEDRRCIQAFAKETERLASLRDPSGKRIFGYPIESLSTQPSFRALDQITMLDYLKQKKWLSPLLTWSINDRCIDEFSVPVDKISAWVGLQFYASVEPLPPLASPPELRMPPELEAIEPSDRKMSWPNGNDFLIQGMLRHIPKENLYPQHFVLEVRNVSDGVLVTYADTRTMKTQTIKTRAVIFAAPKYTVYRCMPELVDQKRDEFRSLLYVPWIVAAMHCRRFPDFPARTPLAWENFRYRGWSQGFINPQHLLKEQPPESAGRVLVFYACLADSPQAQRRELLAEGWDFWSRLILDELRRMHPQLPSLITRLDIMRWGHAMHAPTPGYLFGGARSFMQRPQGRVFFSHCDIAGPAVFEQVTYKGMEAAEQVMAALKHPYTSFL